ncbi:MAG: transposase family protein [Firmicutes bacterium]|nr:transposase family protein [Bacillota bacterium]
MAFQTRRCKVFLRIEYLLKSRSQRLGHFVALTNSRNHYIERPFVASSDSVQNPSIMPSNSSFAQSLSDFAPVYSQFYRQSAQFWALTPPEYARLLLVLGVQIDSSRSLKTTFTQLAKLFGVHRTTISRLMKGLSSWHGPDGAAATPAISLVHEKRNTAHGHRWAGVQITFASWVPIGFGERVQRAPACDQEATQASVQPERTTKNSDPRDFKKALEKKDPPPIPPLQTQEEDSPTAETLSTAKLPTDSLHAPSDQEEAQGTESGVLSLPHVVEGRRLLLNIGVSENNAKRLALKHSPEVIQNMIRTQLHRQNVNDLAGWVVTCLRNLPEPKPTQPKPTFTVVAEDTPRPMPPNPEKEARERFKAWFATIAPATQREYEMQAERLFYQDVSSVEVQGRRQSRQNGGAFWWDFLRRWTETAGLYANNE